MEFATSDGTNMSKILSSAHAGLRLHDGKARNIIILLIIINFNLGEENAY